MMKGQKDELRTKSDEMMRDERLDELMTDER